MKRIVLLLLVLLAACSPRPAAVPVPRTPLKVFCAGSLILPFADLEKAFEAAHPEVDVLNECHGSIQVIRHVTELHEKIDVVATADAALIPMLMYASTDPESGQPYASWSIHFAGNRLALAYTPTSRFAQEITPDNWTEVVARPGVRLGLADPRFDAAGYRGLMALKLAEHSGQKDALERVMGSAFQIPLRVYEEQDFTEIGVPEILESRPGSGVVVRGASIQLIALLESGDLDYAFEYESVIRQHKLQWVALPDAVNLGAVDQAAAYSTVQVKLDFQRFASVKPLFRGEPIAYAVTIPSSAPQPALAAEFLAFLLGPQGQKIMQANHQPMLAQPECDAREQMPAVLRSLCAAP